MSLGGEQSISTCWGWHQGLAPLWDVLSKTRSGENGLCEEHSPWDVSMGWADYM